MTRAADLKRLSRRLSLILRHTAPQLGLTVDPEGYVPVAELLRVLASDEPGLDVALLDAVIAEVEPDKQRFRRVDDWIRANYGHTLAQRIEHAAAPPPALLFHGTAASALPGIRAHGLKPMQRQYVHLTTDESLALRVGARHGKAVCLRVAAAAAAAAGVAFYRANDCFWLAHAVPAAYVDTR
jgi:putative RNA 2'-phosphotransferase